MPRATRQDDSETPVRGPHYGAEQLLLFLDGELSPSEMKQVHSHLEACWSCRVRKEQVERAISDLVQYRDGLVVPHLPRPCTGRTLFLARLDQLATDENQGLDLLSAIRVFLRGRWVMPVGAIAAMTIVVVLVIMSLGRRPAVPTAAALLRASAVADRAMFSNPNAVVHRVVTLEQRHGANGPVMTRSRVETWQAGAGTRKVRRLFSDDGRLMAGEWTNQDGSAVLYERARPQRRVESHQPVDLATDSIWRVSLSAEDFAAAIGGTDTVGIEVEPASYVVRYANLTANQQPRLVNASLRLRRPDFHPIEQTFAVESSGGIDEYRFVETHFDRDSDVEAAASIFAVDSELLQPAAVPAVALEPLYVPATPDLEVEALDRLDQAGALVQEQVTVGHDAQGALLIEGVVGDAQRRLELVEALGPLAHSPAVRVQLHTAEEVEREQAKGRSGPVNVESLEVAQGRVPAGEQVRNHLFAKGTKADDLNRAVQRFADEAFSHSGQAQMHSLVLRQAVRSVSPDDVDKIKPAARQRWYAIINRHAVTVRRQLDELHDQLKPVFGTTQQGLLESPPTVADLSTAAAQLCELVAAADRSVGQSLAVSDRNSTDVPIASSEFWTTLDRARGVASAIVETTKP